MGQHPVGTLDLWVFDQGTWWVDVQQRPHRIDGMSTEYTANVIAYLEENAESFLLATRRRLLIEDVTDVWMGRLPGTLMAEAFGATPVADLTSADWLLGTPLMRSLQRERSRHP